ncbi:MAG: Beta-galactosidase [Lentisphaerae bacterium ADurb.Bin242]|nr:MAG: Beta-galactosidase [Lentisphaerae bacterium ADurb.Bin242]
MDGKKVSSGGITPEMRCPAREYMSCTIDDRIPGEKDPSRFIQPRRRPVYEKGPGLYYSHEDLNAEFFHLPYELPETMPGQEVFLKLTASLAKPRKWAGAGHETAWEQFRLEVGPVLRPAPLPETPSPSLRGGKEPSVSNGWTVLSSGKTFLAAGGVPLILGTPSLNVLRAPLDNDGVRLTDCMPLKRWNDKALYEIGPTGGDVAAAETPGRAALIFDADYSTPAVKSGIRLFQKYVLDSFGIIHGEAVFHVSAELRDLPRLGLLFLLPGIFSRVTWFGRGPHENFRDRNAGAPVGLYTATVEEMHVPYIKPQENGNRTDVRFLVLSSEAAEEKLLVTAPDILEFSVSRYSMKELASKKHDSELVKSDCVFLKLDFMQRGVGSVSCGPDTRQEYRTESGRFVFRFNLCPFSGSTAKMLENVRSVY